MKEIPLTRGKVALVDDEDYEVLIVHKWLAWRSPDRRNWYAKRSVFIDGRKIELMMHSALMVPPAGLRVDHVDRNGLNNTRRNLRLATNAQNLWNRGPAANNTSGYKGVSKMKGGKWQAGIRAHGKHYWLGTHSTAEEAARAYDAKARELHGEFACPNFP